MKYYILRFLRAGMIFLTLGFSASHAAILAIVSSDNSGQFCHFQLDDRADVGIGTTGCYGPSGGMSVLVAPTLAPTNTWRHIVLTVGQGSANIYIDGMLTQSSSIGTANIPGSSAVSIARGFGDSRYFSGSLDEIAIYDSVLSGDRVLSHYNAATLGGYGDYVSQVFVDSPIGYWQLDEVSGTIAVDSSGNGRHGTYVGGVTLGAPSAFSNGNIGSARFDGASGYVSLPGSWGSIPEVTIEAWVNPVPVPAAIWLFASGLLGLISITRKKLV